MAQDINGKHITISGLRITIGNLTAIGQGAPKYLHDVLLRCLSLDFMPKWMQHVDLQDHSLEDLRKLGHPYASRYGVDSFVHPDEYIHEQTGDFIRDVHIEDNNVDGVQLVSTSPYYKYLRYGTSVMRIRDPASAALLAAIPAIKQRLAVEIKDAIVKVTPR